jgi:HSP20 family protein
MIGSVASQFRDAPAELAEDARELLADIEHDVPGAAGLTADCRPPLDILETASSVEVVVDLPGVPARAVRVAIRHSTLLIVGIKPGVPLEPRASYHLAERNYGRFARVVRLAGAFDGRRAKATFAAGQLRVVLPLLEDRRGRLLPIAVEIQ